ncbi:hypothetical protein CsSME_00011794 [Camellia sinensis var. sinensis]
MTTTFAAPHCCNQPSLQCSTTVTSLRERERDENLGFSDLKEEEKEPPSPTTASPSHCCDCLPSAPIASPFPLSSSAAVSHPLSCARVSKRERERSFRSRWPSPLLRPLLSLLLTGTTIITN